jgi:hypothetical protein
LGVLLGAGPFRAFARLRFDDSFAEGKHCKEERMMRVFLEELLFAGLRKVNPSALRHPVGSGFQFQLSVIVIVIVIVENRKAPPFLAEPSA